MEANKVLSGATIGGGYVYIKVDQNQVIANQSGGNWNADIIEAWTGEKVTNFVGDVSALQGRKVTEQEFRDKYCGTPCGPGFPIVANDDSYTIDVGSNSGTESIFDNDTFRDKSITKDDVVLDVLDPLPAGITVDEDGIVHVDNNVAGGTYTFDYVICDPVPMFNHTCDQATVTVEVPAHTLNNYWMGGTQDNENAWWEKDNWTANYVPEPSDDIMFATVDNYGTAAVEDLHLDKDRIIGDLINESSKDLIITTGNQLIIEGEIIDNNAIDGTIVIKTDIDEPTGTLIFTDPVKNQDVEATVEFYNQAYECDDCGYYRNQWQYFGIPVKEADFPYLTPQLETVNQWVEPYSGNKWRPAPYAPDTKLKAFKGYEVTSSSITKPTHIYEFTGELNVGDVEVPLINTADVNYQGMNLLANSYTAALAISEDAIVDAGSILEEETAYLYNTGTRDQWRKLDGTSVSGIEGGRYLAVPFNMAGQLGLPDQIPSMHNFMLNAKSSGSIELKYNKLVKTITDTNTPVWRSKVNSPNILML